MYDSDFLDFLVIVISVGLTSAWHNQLCYRNVAVSTHSRTSLNLYFEIINH